MPFIRNKRLVVSDIYPADRAPITRRHLPPAQPPPAPPKPPSRTRRLIAIVLGVVMFAGILFYGARIFAVRSFARQSTQAIVQRAESAQQALAAFDTAAARAAFVDISTLLADIQTEANRYGLRVVASLVGIIKPSLAAAPQALATLAAFSNTAITALDGGDFLKAHAFDLIVNRRGNELLSRLTSLRDQFHTLGGLLEKFQQQASSGGYPLGDDLLSFQVKLYRSEKLLDTAITWLSGVNHLALLFVNPSEIRPGGGFPGSYTAITLERGNLASIEVRDIYDPDGQLTSSIIPPLPLQLITKTWGARDANWFFDFPTSAHKTLFFLNDSKIYTEQDLHFSALAAINVEAVSDVLGVIGPVELPEYGLTLTAENFLDEVQEEVRSGPDREVGEPKRILKVLTPILFEKIAELSSGDKQELIKRLQARLTTKDMMAYVDEPVMEAYLEQLQIAGEVEQEDGTANLYEYLAVVNANIGGGKSDAVVSQKIALKSQIDLEGKINNVVKVTRTHHAKGSSPAWYYTTNKNYLQVYTPRGSRIISSKGVDTAPAIPVRDYEGSTSDPDVTAIERSTEPLASLNLERTLAFDKTVFAGWLNTKPGTTRTLELQYTNPQKLRGQEATSYRLVLEKQSGVESAFTFTIDAPPEYKWAETNSPVFIYETDAIPGRLVLNLTLIPIR